MKKILYDAKWIKLYENSKGYIIAERKNKDSIAILCFKIINNQYWFLIRYQPLVYVENIEDKIYPCLITGSLDSMNEDLISTSERELKEEAGLMDFHNSVLIKQYKYVSSTQMNEVVNLFLFDVSNNKFGTPITDGTYYESISYNKWVSEEEFKQISLGYNSLKLSCLPIAYLLFIEYKNSRR